MMFKSNKLHTKLIVLLAIILFIFISGLIFFRHAEIKRLTILTDETANEKAVFLEKLLELKSEPLKTLVTDYTFYDEMVSFIKTGDKKWAKENIDTALDTFKTSSIWIYKTNLSIAYKVNNPESKKLKNVPFSESSFEKLFENNKFPHFFVWTDEGLMEIIGATIHPAADYERKSGTRGYFFTGRLWSVDYLKKLSKLTESSIEILPYNGETSSIVFNNELNAFIFKKIMYTWDGSPLAVMHVQSPAPVMKESIRSFNISLISLLTLSVVILFAISFFIARWIIRPLRSISKSLETENPVFLDSVKKDNSEFSDMSILIERFFEQRESLVKEILEHEETEKALIDSQTRFKSLFEFSPDAIYLATLGGRMVDCNSAASEMSGYPKEELLHMAISDLITFESGKNIFDIIKIKLPSDVYFAEHNCKRKGDSVFPVELSAKLIEINKESFFIFIVRDITEKRKIQKEFLRTRQIESLGILAGGIAHDFNNFLTGIMGNISLAKFFAKPDDKIFERLTIAENASMKAKDLTQQLLTFAKGGAPIKEVASISEALKESINFILSGTNVKCSFDMPDDLWMIEADIGQMNQVINNLIINAMHAMPEGGKIDVMAENAETTLANELPIPAGKYVKVSVRDYGNGIPEDDITKIFEPYYTTKENGSGLGLAVVYSIIKRHKGHITVESRPGIGTTFTFYLPATQNEKQESYFSEKDIKHVQGRVLVMDDADFIREILLSFLQHLGFEVEYAKDGSEAIDLYKKAMNSDKPFDVVIMDLTVPGGMGGKDAIKVLLEIDPEVNAIVSSGYSDDLVMANYSEYGFKGALTKPFRIERLNELLLKIFHKNNYQH